MSEKKAKLLISISLDNSASMKGEKIEILKKSILSFSERIEKDGLNECLDFSITVFKGFNCSLLKSFGETVISKEFSAGGIPFVDLSIEKSIEELKNAVDELNNDGVPYFKPWLIVLSNGENYGNVDIAVDLIKQMATEGKLTYFPFALSDREFDASLNNLRKLKKFITIKDSMYDDLFNWIYTIAKKRVETPIDQSFGLDGNSYDGWTVK